VATFAQEKIEGYVGPKELGAADNLEQVIVDFIGGAQRTLDIAVQELDNEAIAQAILNARFRGVSVRMVVEQDYLLTGKLPAVRARAGETEADALHRVQWGTETGEKSLEENRRIQAALLRCNVDIKSDYNPEIFHQKFVIRDYRGDARPTSALLSGSANFTVTDCHQNLNHIVIFHDVRVCKEYAGEFASIRAGHFGSIYVPFQVLPRQPIPDLRVRCKQQHVAVAQFKRQHQTRVVGRTIKLKRERRRRVEPTAVDAAPALVFFLRVVVFTPVVLLEKRHLLGHVQRDLKTFVKR